MNDMIEIMYSQATLTMPYLLITGKPVLVSTSVLEANLSLWDHLRTRKGGGVGGGWKHNQIISSL